jgi:hypothetical protein
VLHIGFGELADVPGSTNLLVSSVLSQPTRWMAESPSVL